MVSDPTRWQGGLVAQRRRIVGAFSANSAGLVVALIFQLASVPLLLALLGTDAYGTWIILTAIPSYLTLSNLGFSNASSTFATRQMAESKPGLANRAMSTCWLAVMAAAIVVAVLIMIGSTLLIPASGLHTATKLEALLVIAAQLAFFLLYIHSGFCEGAYRASGLQARGANWITLLRAIDLSAIALSFALGLGIVGVAVMLLIFRTMSTAVLTVRVHQAISWWRFERRAFDRRTLIALARPSMAFVGFSFGAAVLGQGMVLAIGAGLGAASVVVFSTVRTVTSLIRQAISVPDRSLTPELTVALSRRDSIAAMRVVRILLVVSLGGALIAAVGLSFAGPTIISIWTSGDITPTRLFIALMLVTVLFDTPWQIASSVVTSMNRHQMVSVVYVAASLACVGLTVFLLPSVGLNAAPIAMLGTSVLVSPVAIPQAIRIVRESSDS